MKKVLMASLVMAVFAVAALLFQLTSCKKAIAQTTNDCPPPTYPVEGLYIGTYTADSKPELGSLYYSFIIFPDGALLTKGVTEFGDTAYQKGSWKLLSDSTFTGIIATFTTPSVIQSISGKFSKDGKINDASWRDTYNPYGSGLSGHFSVMQRIN